MSKSRLVKTMTLPIRPGTTSARLAGEVAELEVINKQLVPGAMRQWLLAGFELGQLEHGIMESWLAMANGGQLRNMTSRQKADVLKNIIDRTIWLEEPEQTPTQEPVKPQEEPILPSAVTAPAAIVTVEEKDAHGIPSEFDLCEEY